MIGETDFQNGDGIMALLAQSDGLLWGEILVEEQPHDASTISLLARLAAYWSAAVMWSLVNCG